MLASQHLADVLGDNIYQNQVCTFAWFLFALDHLSRCNGCWRIMLMADKSLGKTRFLSLNGMGCWCEAVQHDGNDNWKKEREKEAAE
jgi:hypothetical protein